MNIGNETASTLSNHHPLNNKEGQQDGVGE